MTDVMGFDGILFIGDAHQNSRRPGRRIDNYAGAIHQKLEQAAQIQRERNLFPVFLGDLFHRARENDLELLSKMVTVFRTFTVTPLLLGGSHDATETKFTDKDAVSLMAKFGALRLVDQPGKVVTLNIKGMRVALWATPAGALVPTTIDAEPDTQNIMITHHDFDFRGMYPGAHELREIENCDMLVNGHMHTPAPVVLKGRTACHNPGSISRPSIDLLKHKPVVSVWTPAHGLSLESVPLVVADDVFDMTGKEVFAADPKTLKASLPKGLRLSAFATKLRASESLEAARTDDGSVLVEELNTYLEMFDKPDNLKRYLAGLLKEVLEERTES